MELKEGAGASGPRAGALAAVLVSLLLAPGCGFFDARMELKHGNSEYKAQHYTKAIEYYERIPKGSKERVWAALNSAYAYMAQYRFGSKSEKDRTLAAKAVESFDEYLKVRDPEQKDEHLADEDKVQEWIVTLLVDSERYEEAIRRLEAGLLRKPGDPALMRGIATAYDKWGKPTMALHYFQEWAQKFPKDSSPEAAIAAYCWNMSYRVSGDMTPLERNRWVDNGLAAAEAALKIDDDSFEANTYRNLLLRERSKLRVDPDQVAELLQQASKYLEKAKAIRQKQKEAEEAKAKAAPSPKPGTKT